MHTSINSVNTAKCPLASPPFIFPFLLELQTKKKKKSFLSISNGAVVSGKGLLCSQNGCWSNGRLHQFLADSWTWQWKQHFYVRGKKISSFRYFYCIMHHIPPDVRALKKKKILFCKYCAAFVERPARILLVVQGVEEEPYTRYYSYYYYYYYF